ncbi:uncharacterized protein LOC124204620 isoform X2 [Daphnia pulex]|uniref:uncharacterized protein LOC124204620 isoform X2 n=1 Tax=Daphnia pulex TaxID=6669 RepID=UPI001EDDA9E0|nr:uncharacterized protein LOC124204620 isoform X2 [Daphnia pulex]
MSQFCLPSAGQQRDLLNCSIWPDNNRLLWGSIGFEFERMGSSMSSMGSNVHPLFYFDPDVRWTPERPDYCSTKWELREKLDNLADASEKIKEVSWFWSIEKDEGGITIQRSKRLDDVRDQCRKHGRMTGLTTGIALAHQGPSNATVIELLSYMWTQNCMNLDYHFLGNNCQNFANLIFGNFVLPPFNEVPRVNIKLNMSGSG